MHIIFLPFSHTHLGIYVPICGVVIVVVLLVLKVLLAKTSAETLKLHVVRQGTMYENSLRSLFNTTVWIMIKMITICDIRDIPPWGGGGEGFGEGYIILFCLNISNNNLESYDILNTYVKYIVYHNSKQHFKSSTV